jgi:hypothetical protein
MAFGFSEQKLYHIVLRLARIKRGFIEEYLAPEVA